ncbi:MAG: type II secretion system protein [Candidatus Paceibacterota bacterium]|jgi:type II secretory pathway pseudopilin PulG
MFRKKIKLRKNNRGMTYVELIVVLGIVGAMTSVIIFNYGSFQAKVDIRNLANDVALKIVEAQKSAMSGKLPITGLPSPDWKPSYGVYFNSSASPDIDSIPFNKKIVYFVDNDSDGFLATQGELLNPTTIITKNNFIKSLTISGSGNCAPTKDLSIVFRRSDSVVKIKSTDPNFSGCVVSFASIIVSSSKGDESEILIYPSGRIEMN